MTITDLLDECPGPPPGWGTRKYPDSLSRQRAWDRYQGRAEAKRKAEAEAEAQRLREWVQEHRKTQAQRDAEAEAEAELRRLVKARRSTRRLPVAFSGDPSSFGNDPRLSHSKVRRVRTASAWRSAT